MNNSGQPQVLTSYSSVSDAQDVHNNRHVQADWHRYVHDEGLILMFLGRNRFGSYCLELGVNNLQSVQHIGNIVHDRVTLFRSGGISLQKKN